MDDLVARYLVEEKMLEDYWEAIREQEQEI
jgi:hypothetical protein